MQKQNRQIKDKGSALVETLVGSIFLMLFTFFTIDLSQTTFTLHRINYLSKKSARGVCLSAGKRVGEIKEKSRNEMLPALSNDLRAGRIQSINISLLNQDGNRLPNNTTIESASVLTFRVDANLSMSFVPFRLFALFAPSAGSQMIFYLPDGRFHYKTDVTFIVE